VGECLEDAVRREVFEETGVRVGEVIYQGSQGWPFPAGLMIGFRARALTEEFSLDPQEIDEARWFTRQQLSAHAEQHRLGRVDSIDRRLLESWLG
jgi:NAD+ diphosphatase